MKRALSILSGVVCLFPCAAAVRVFAQGGSVTATVSVARTLPANSKSPAEKAKDDSNVAIWLTPLGNASNKALASASSPRLVQRHKTFEPHVLIVPVGTLVAFPNKDPFFHNIFSLYDGKRFDLGLYEAGTTRSVLFDRPGVSFLFCNIHAEMSAVVIAVNTPYFGISDRSGHVVIPNVPAGRYELSVWYERSLSEELKGLSRTVTISASNRDLGTIRVNENPDFTIEHKNKYGLDYVPPPNPAYNHP
jgi:plastocyanin